MYTNIVFSVTNSNFLAQYSLQSVRVVSPTLIINLTLFIILCKKNYIFTVSQLTSLTKEFPIQIST